MSGKTVACCGLILIIFILFLIGSSIYHDSYERSAEVREAHAELEDEVTKTIDSLNELTLPILKENTNMILLS